VVCGADHATVGPQAKPSVLAAGLRGKRGPAEPSESWAPRDPSVPRLAYPIVRGRPLRHPASSVTPPSVDSPDGRFVVEIYTAMRCEVESPSGQREESTVPAAFAMFWNIGNFLLSAG